LKLRRCKLENFPKTPKEWLSETFCNSAISYSLGTADSYLTHLGIRSSEEVADNVFAPDNLLNAAAVIIPYVAIKGIGTVLEGRKNRALTWTGKQIRKYAGLLATVPALIYEVVETITGVGIHPQSTPTSAGTLKDVVVYLFTGITLYTFDRALEKYKESQDLSSPVIIKSPEVEYTSLD